jgi:hypothetical protein
MVWRGGGRVGILDELSSPGQRSRTCRAKISPAGQLFATVKGHSEVVIRTDPPVPKPAVLSLPTRLPSEPADHSSDA